MAYTVTGNTTPANVRQTRSEAGRQLVFDVSEIEAAAGSEFSIGGLPPVGTIVAYKATLTAGTGTTVNPSVGSAASFTTTGSAAARQGHVATNTTTAAHVNDRTPLPYHAPSGTLYFRSAPNDLTADHTILTRIVITDRVG